MTDRAVITFAASVFESDDLLVFSLLNHFGGDFSAAGNVDLAAIDVSNHFERSRLARLNVQKIDIDRLAFRDTILPSTSLDDCVGHKVFSWEKKPRNVSQNGSFGKQKGRGGSPNRPWRLGLIADTRDQNYYLAFWRMFLVMGEQFGRRAAAEFLELFGQLAGDAELSILERVD